MKKLKRKTITDLRNSLFETFDEVVSGEPQVISHKNGNEVAMLSIEKMNELYSEVELHKNLAIGYAQALRGEGVSSAELKERLKTKEKNLRKKYA
jgi:prevent-host-death family protein